MINHIPCAPGAHIGEVKTLSFLKQNLHDCTILSNYHHPDRSGTKEIDLMVINNFGVWLLEVKHWWGEIVADEVHWNQGRRKQVSPITSIEHKSKLINSDLCNAEFKNISVVGLVILSKGTNSLIISDKRKNRVFGLDQNLIRALSTRDLIFSPRSKMLNNEQINKVARNFVNKHVDPEYKIVGNYQLIEELPSGDHYLAYEGQHTQIKSRRAKIKRYHLEVVNSQKHLEEAFHNYKQSMEALSQVSGHPNIVAAYDFFPDVDTSDTFWQITEYIDGKTLRQQIDEMKSFTFQEQFDILFQLGDAIDFCHKHQIVHRNLNPEFIYITGSGQIKVDGFDFSKVPALGYTITKTNEPFVYNKYVAPEQHLNPRNVDCKADFYSLGAIWYDLAFNIPASEPILLSKIKKSDLPKEIIDLMSNLLSNQPDKRPDNWKEIRESLDSLRTRKWI
ncbi:MAG: protein kinase [Brevefilum sp.]|nr:protein kinase [Brevefilum sp.]